MSKIPQPIHRDPEIMGGTPVFRGTRVPLQTLFDVFLEHFPTVSRQQAIAALEFGKDLSLERAAA